MFGKKKDRKKKSHSIKYVMLQNGLSNFINDCVIEVVIDEPNNTINFIEAKKNGVSASLLLNKIIRLETGTRDKTVVSNSTGAAIIGGMVAGTTGAIIGASTGNKAQSLQTLKIIYSSNNEEKEINLYQTNYGNVNAIMLIKTILDINIQENLSVPKHIDL